jgi:hypothetical protein
MLTKAVLFHFIQLGCVPIFTPFEDFSPFSLQRVKIIIKVQFCEKEIE